MAYYHFAEMILRKAEHFGEKTILKTRNKATGVWGDISYRELADKVFSAAKAMSEFGVQVQENLGVFSQNMAECVIVDFAGFTNRAVMVPLYATSSPAQVEYIVNDAAIRTLFVGEQLQYNCAYKVQKDSKILERLVVFDKEVKFHPEDKTSIYFEDFLKLGDESTAEADVKIRISEACEEDLANILYTSGTTGEPKGVMIHHSNYAEVLRIHDERLTMLSENDLSMCFLPLTHIFEKAWSYYCLHKGITVAVNHDPKIIQQTIKEVRPTLMCSVPRFWEKVYAGVQDKINSSEGLMRKLFLDAIETGRKYNLDYINNKKNPPLGLKLKFNFYNKTIYSKLKKVIGIENGVLFPCSGASLNDEIIVFLKSVNIPIIYGYGMTETTATVSCYPEFGFELGTVGTLMPGVQAKIGENNELLLKGKTITKGYYNKPEANKEAFIDGWLRTGDAASLQGDVLSLKDRIKDLYKTANGKYIAPQAIEAKMGGDKYIEMIAVIGDKRKFVSALIVPAYPMLEEYAKKRGIKYDSMDDLVNNEDIQKLIEARIEEHQKTFASYEKIKRFKVLANPFTMESGELTNTLKVRRAVILNRYADLIDSMYQE